MSALEPSLESETLTEMVLSVDFGVKEVSSDSSLHRAVFHSSAFESVLSF